MAKMGIVETKGKNVKQILANSVLFQSFGAQVAATGVNAADGRKIIPAGTPVGGDNDFYEDEQAELVVTNNAENGAKTQGVLLHDVDVTNGTNNATVLVFGYVNINRLDEKLTIVDEAKTALDGKVTFVKRN